MADKELVMKLEEDISWLEQGCTTEREICEHIKQAIKTIIHHKETENPWHTGTPTEEGEYICWTIFPKDICRDPEGSWKCKWENGKWFDAQIDDNLSMDSLGVEVIAWQKITPYKEGE